MIFLIISTLHLADDLLGHWKPLAQPEPQQK